MREFRITAVSPKNAAESGIYCIKDKKAPGFAAKLDWLEKKLNGGLRIKIAEDAGKQLGFIEFAPAEAAWRPIDAPDYLFIHCIAIFSKDARQLGIGAALIKAYEDDAKAAGKNGVCTMVSSGPWMAGASLFEKAGFEKADSRGRYELMSKRLKANAGLPSLKNWEEKQAGYKGWHLIYADQCPWHEKSVKELSACALENGIELKVKKLKTPQEAQNAPSGFGVFSLIKDGVLLEDHYLSRRRFENIIKKYG